MGNPKKIAEIIKEREKRYIDLDDDISVELLEILGNTSSYISDSLFVRCRKNTDDKHQHSIHFICCECRKECVTTPQSIREVKAWIQEQRKGILADRCGECQEIYDNKIKEEQKEQEIKRKQKQKEDKKQQEEITDLYILEFLNPYNEWEDGISYKERWNQINYLYINRERVVEYIKNMDYKEFMDTLYWKTVSQQRKYRAGFKCELCNSNKNLATHHKTYKRHGYEHDYYMQDLICLCSDCHKKFHEIKE